MTRAASGSSVAAAVADVHTRMARAAEMSGRDAASVKLVAVSKTYPVSSVQDALAAGLADFGENRVQEAAAKFSGLRSQHPGLRLHLIGPLQTNKAADAAGLADVIETLDRERLADALDQAAQKAGRTPALLIQVNLGDEPQKAGVPSAAADAFITACRRRFGAAVKGLMTIPPVDRDPTPFFRRLAELAAVHGLAELSMGMSGDFEQAIAAGATSVRIGSAIFGSRPLPAAAPATQLGIPAS